MHVYERASVQACGWRRRAHEREEGGGLMKEKR